MTFTGIHLKLIVWMIRCGAEESAIPAELGITPEEFAGLRAEQPAINEAIKDAKQFWLTSSEMSLKKLAAGYTTQKTTTAVARCPNCNHYPNCDKCKSRLQKVTRVDEHVPPNVAAATFLAQHSRAFAMAKTITDKLPAQSGRKR